MEIITEPDKILRQTLTKISANEIDIGLLILEMKKTMREKNGVGLAANQIGKNLQLFVIDEKLAKENSVPDVYINPEITEYSKDEAVLEEGCLSLPKYWEDISRAKKIKIKLLDENGKKVKFRARGFLARVLQHECDHLSGILIKDRAR